MNASSLKRFAALCSVIALAICIASAQEGWAGYGQTGHWTTTNKDGTTTDHDTGKNEDGDTIRTDTVRDGDGRAISERTEVKGKDGKTKYIRMTKWGNPDKPWEITWGYLYDLRDNHPDFKYDPKTGEWKRESTKLNAGEEITLKTGDAPIMMKRDGAIVIEGKTLYGNLLAYFPKDMASGDTISGEIIVEPKGKNDAERAKNESILEGCVIEVEKQKTNAGNGHGKWVIPAGAGALAVVLLDRQGHRIGGQTVPVHASRGPWAGGFQLPKLLQSGQPMPIQGPFDGDLSNTRVQFGGRELPILAESPRSIVVQSPPDRVGMSEIVVNESGTSTSGPCRNVGISLAIDKPALHQGDSAQIVMTISGLSDLQQPLTIHLTTRSEGAAQMVGGNDQDMLIQPGEVGSDGSCRKTLTLSGSHAGRFTVAGTVTPNWLDSLEVHNAVTSINAAEWARRAATEAKAKDPKSKEAAKAEQVADNAETQAAASMMGWSAAQRAAVYRKVAQEHRDRAKQIRKGSPTLESQRQSDEAEAKAEDEMAKEADNKADAQGK